MLINKKEKGSALLEALISVLLFAICLVGILEYQSYMAEMSYQAKYKTEAIELANKLITQIMLDKNNTAKYATGGAGNAEWDNEVKILLPNASTNVVVNGTEVVITINWITENEKKEISGTVQDVDKHQYQITTYVSYS